MPKPLENRFADVDACARTLAERVSSSIRQAIETFGNASVIVSGGKTPLAFFERLRELEIDWPRVDLSLADERWVEVDDPSSNEGFVRRHLLRGRAASARLIGLKTAAVNAREGAASAWARLAALRRPFDAVLLGMGDDGHTASLFPASPDLERALEERAAPACIAMTAPTPPHERLTLNLAALLDSRLIVLLIAGEDKWEVYRRAMQGSDVAEMPVRALFRQTRCPVELYWSP